MYYILMSLYFGLGICWVSSSLAKGAKKDGKSMGSLLIGLGVVGLALPITIILMKSLSKLDPGATVFSVISYSLLCPLTILKFKYPTLPIIGIVKRGDKEGETREMSAKDFADRLERIQREYIQGALDPRLAKKDRPKEGYNIQLELDAANDLEYFTRHGGKTVNINQIESKLKKRLLLYKQAESLPVKKARKLLREISSSETDEELYKKMRRVIRQTNRALEILEDIKS